MFQMSIRILPADGLAPLGAKIFADKGMTKFLHQIYRTDTLRLQPHSNLRQQWHTVSIKLNVILCTWLNFSDGFGEPPFKLGYR